VIFFDELLLFLFGSDSRAENNPFELCDIGLKCADILVSFAS